MNKKTEVTQEEKADLVSSGPGPLVNNYPSQQPVAISQADRLIELAITQNADMDRLEKLLDLKERYEKEEARKAYTAAMAGFKGEGIVIEKDRLVAFPHKDGPGETSYTHASLGNIVGIAVPMLAKHGLSHKWEVERDKDRINVRCVMTHKDGHSEKTEWWPGPLDNSGKKNPIQQAASTVTYLERYTFLAITGLAVKEQDDDGQVGGGAPEPEVELISDDQQNKIHSILVDNNLDKPIFMKWLLTKSRGKITAISEIPVDIYDKVLAQLNQSIKNMEGK